MSADQRARKLQHALFSAAGAVALATASASAQDGTGWTGTAGNNNWSTPGNWDNGAPGGLTRDLFFGNGWFTAGGTGATTANNDISNLDLHKIVFESNASTPSFTITGNGFRMFDFGGASPVFPQIVNNSNVLQTFNLSSGSIQFNDTSGNNKAEILANGSGDLTFSNTSLIDLASVTQLQFNSTAGRTITLNGVISSSGNSGGNSVAINGNNIVVYGAANTYSGDTFINAGALQFASGGSATSTTIRLGDTSGTAPATLSLINPTGGQNMATTVVVRSGSSGVKTIKSTNTSGTNTYSGNWFLDAAVTVSSDNSGATLALTGTTLDLKNQTMTVTGSGDTTISGNLVNPTGGENGSLAKSGSGILTLSGTNTYRGATTVTGGVVSISADTHLGSAPGAVTPAAVTLNGGTLRYTGSVTVPANRGFTFGPSAGTIEVIGTNTVTANNVIAGTGFNKTGTGTLVLGANSTTTGNRSIRGGEVRIDSALRIPNSGTVTLDGGALVQTNPTSAGSFLQSSTNLDIGTGGGTVSYTGSAGSVSLYAGTIRGPASVLHKIGTGEFRYQGTGLPNTSYAKLVVHEGLFRLGFASSTADERGFGAVPGSFTADAITLDGGAIGISFNTSLHPNRGITLGAGGGTWNSGTSAGTISGAITGVGGFTRVAGSGTLRLLATSDFSGGFTLLGDRVEVWSNDGLGVGPLTFTMTGSGTLVNNNTPAADVTLGNSVVNLTAGTNIDIAANSGRSLTLTGKLTGPASWKKDNAASTGTVVLTNSTSDFTGGVTVFAGQIAITANSALGSAGGATTINSSASLVMRGGFNYTTAEPLTIGAGGPGNGSGVSPGAINNAADNNRFAGPITMSATSSIGVAAGELELAGPISGAFRLSKVGPGALVLSNAGNAFSSTTISAGVLSVSSDGNLGTVPGAPSATNLIINDGATLRATSNFTISTNRGIQLAASGTGIIDVAPAATLSYAGDINSGSLDKRGTGILHLSGASSYAGTTTITAGTIRVANTTGSALGTGPVVVTSAGTIAGSGSFTGALSLAGTIAPGNSVGQITTGSQDWQGGGSYAFEIADANDGPGTGWDHIQLTTLSISATPANKFIIVLNSNGVVPNDFVNPPPHPPGNYEWVIATATGGITGFDPGKFQVDASNFVGVAPGGHFKLQLASSDTQLRLVYVPEPGAAMLALLGALVSLRRRHR